MNFKIPRISDNPTFKEIWDARVEFAYPAASSTVLVPPPTAAPPAL